MLAHTMFDLTENVEFDYHYSVNFMDGSVSAGTLSAVDFQAALALVGGRYGQYMDGPTHGVTSIYVGMH